MRNFFIPLTLVAAMGMSTVAFAATATITEGTIKSVDGKAMTLTLQDGTVYHLGKTIKVSELKAGEKVKVTWEKSGANMDASAVALVK